MSGPPVMRTARAPASAIRSAAETTPIAGVPASALCTARSTADFEQELVALRQRYGSPTDTAPAVGVPASAFCAGVHEAHNQM